MIFGAYVISIFITVLQTIVLAVLLVLSIKLIGKNERNLPSVHMAFCLTLWLLGNIYWLIYDLIRPESRMPFAANEIGEAAAFLMMAAIINSVVISVAYPSAVYTVSAILFGIGNVALWIAWSGEWIQDIFIGTFYTWFLLSLVRALVNEKTLRTWEWVLLCILCFALIAGQGQTFVIKTEYVRATETGAYVILFMGILLFVNRLIRLYKENEKPQKLLFVAFALIAWVITGKYMSDGTMYTVFMLLETMSLPVCFAAVRKVVMEQ